MVTFSERLFSRHKNFEDVEASKRNGIIAMVAISLANLYFLIVLRNPIIFIDIGITAICIYGVTRYSRAAAVVQLGLFVLAKLMLFPNTLSSFVASLIVLLLLIDCTSGMYANHRLVKAFSEERRIETYE